MKLSTAEPSKIGAAVELLRLRALLEYEAATGEREVRFATTLEALRSAGQRRVIRIRRALLGGEDETRTPASCASVLREVVRQPTPITGLSHENYLDQSFDDCEVLARAINLQHEHRACRPYWLVLNKCQPIAPGCYLLQLHVPRDGAEGLVLNMTAAPTRQGVRNCLPPSLHGFAYDDFGAPAAAVEIWAGSAGLHARSPAWAP